MPRGGPRPGSGRPKGPAKATQILEKLKLLSEEKPDGSLTPLEVMINVMNAKYTAGDFNGAVDVASKVAPFVHARLANVQGDIKSDQRVVFVIETGVPKATALEGSKKLAVEDARIVGVGALPAPQSIVNDMVSAMVYDLIGDSPVAEDEEQEEKEA